MAAKTKSSKSAKAKKPQLAVRDLKAKKNVKGGGVAAPVGYDVKANQKW